MKYVVLRLLRMRLRLFVCQLVCLFSPYKVMEWQDGKQVWHYIFKNLLPVHSGFISLTLADLRKILSKDFTYRVCNKISTVAEM